MNRFYFLAIGAIGLLIVCLLFGKFKAAPATPATGPVVSGTSL